MGAMSTHFYNTARKPFLFVFQLLFFAFGLFFVPAEVQAQAPMRFSYQAVVRDGNDVLVRGQAVGVRVQILQGSSTGSSVYSETHLPTTNANGLFTIIVGSGSNVSGDIADIDWGHGPFFLSVDIDPEGGNDYVLNAVQQLMSVPYALYADSCRSSGASGAGNLGEMLEQSNDAERHRIANVLDPTAPQEVATKHYVDSIAAMIANTIYAEYRDTMACLELGGDIEWRGATYSSNGLFFFTMLGAGTNGVDSIIRLHLSIGASTHNAYAVERCAGYTWPLNGVHYDASGDYVRNYVNAQDCPSADTLHLTIHSVYNINDHRSVCDSLRWDNGVLYTSSINNVVQNLRSSHDCDSVVTLNLTVNYSNSGTDVQISSSAYTWINGVTYYTATATPRDTITNVAGCDSIVTLNLTIIPEGSLPGTFTVSLGNTVRFSRGNLQYKASAYTWRFAEHQYDIVGNAAGNTAPSISQSEWIDLFGWGTSGYHVDGDASNTQYYPYSTSTADVDGTNNQYGYGPSINQSVVNLVSLSARYDWGIHNPVSNGGNRIALWRTLTHDEWNHLLNVRTTTTVNGTANARYAKATVNGQTGLIVFPDSYVHPNDVTQPVAINLADAVYGTNTYTAEQFASMELAGAVFLPAAGYRSTTTISDVSASGLYWSSTSYDKSSAYGLNITSALVNSEAYHNRYMGFSVRLVRETNNVCGYLPRFSTDVIEGCDSLRWIDGVKYFNNNNTATHVVRTPAGCDSTVALNLTLHFSAASVDNRYAEESFTWINGVTYYESNNSAKDTLRTIDGCDSVVTLNLTLVPEGGLPGAFTVSAGKTVRFSKGNLQYQSSSDTWRFAHHQYDVIGANPGNTSPSASQTAWMDLFGWATSGWPGANSYRPYSTSNNDADYYPGGNSNTNITGNYMRGDWGINNPIFNGGNQEGMWRTLSQPEWAYLFYTRAASNVNGVANARYCRATVNGIGGMVLFPDVYTHPQNVPQPVRINADAAFNSNVYTVDQFDLMEKAGAVFLPAAGYREVTTVRVVGANGYYWSSSYYYDWRYAYHLYFDAGLNPSYGNDRIYGFSVRLVRESDNHCGFLPRYSVDVRDACDSLVWRDGVKYIASNNTASVSLQTPSGCDSTVYLNLTIHTSLATTDYRISEEPLTWIDGHTYTESNTTAVDSLHSIYGCDSVVTLNFTLMPRGVLQGTFSVANGTTVVFSKGNLQYQGSTDTWRFAGHQYDIVGNALGNTAPSALQTEWIDLFGWGTSGWNSGANSYRPYSTSTNNGDYYLAGAHNINPRGLYIRADWGAYNRISNADNAVGVWRTLSRAEWEYLISYRTASNVNGVANARFCKAVVYGVNGMIIFPDSYTHPGIVPQPNYINNGGAGYAGNVYNADQFAQMEAAGAVFLPAAGFRNGTGIGYPNSVGYYWSTDFYDHRSYFLYFDNGGVNPNGIEHRMYGFAVRLVKGSDLTPCGYLNRWGTDVLEACDSLTWIDGVKYIASNNTATYVVQTDAGCDSTVHLNLTIHNSLASTDYQISEDPIVWIDGHTYTESNTTAVDSLHSIYGCDSVVTLNFTLMPRGILQGTFSVANGTTVVFSKGNLQYQGSTDTWRFAGHQYDYVGNALGNTAPSAGQTEWIDLFGWGTSGWNSGANSYRPYSTSTNNGDYYLAGAHNINLRGLFVRADWGAYNRISNADNSVGVWRTLSRAEWEYLVYYRTASNVNGVANARFCKAVVYGVNGMIIFPDSYTHPAIVPQPNYINNGGAGYAGNVYNADQFAQMEAAGAVFLPAAGLRSGTGISYPNSIGFYWSTDFYDHRSYFLYFDNGSVNPNGIDHRMYGFAVRLVKGSDLTPCGYLNRWGTDVLEACDSLTWIDGVKYIASNNTATYVVQTDAGCDSTVHLNLTIHNSLASTDYRISEDPIVWIDGHTYTESNTTAVDSLHSIYGCDSVVTLNFTLMPRGILQGTFSVANGTTVVFSKGNLQYQGSTDTWRFAGHQYDIVGNALGNIAPSAGQTEWIDLFGWGTSGWNSGANSYRPYSTSTNNGDYYLAGAHNNNLRGLFVRADWGAYNRISNADNSVGVWRTLSRAEWEYLVYYRTASNVNGISNARFCKAVVYGVNGMIIFPDSYTHPAIVPQPNYINNGGAGYAGNVYNADQFAQMEAAGAVFLPAAGYRSGTGIGYPNSIGYYWSTDFYDHRSYFLYFDNGSINPNAVDNRMTGFAVRLVKGNDLTPCGYLNRWGTDVIEACDSLTWIDGVKYITSNNTATYVVQTAAGCDSTVHLNLTIHPSLTTTDHRMSEDALTWINGVSYSESTDAPIDSLHTIYGCDSVVHLSFTRVEPGILPGVFRVSSSNTVRFSKGNLQYQGSTDTWRFAGHQYDYIGNNAGNTAPSALQTAWMDLFGFGTSGWNSGAVAYRPYSTSTNSGEYYPGGRYTNNLTGIYVRADWGAYNRISNADNTVGVWRTLSRAEWEYLMYTRVCSNINGVSNARYAKAVVYGVNGMILFPDIYTHPDIVPQPNAINCYNCSFASNVYSLDQFSQMEAEGAVFLPAGGYRDGAGVGNAGGVGYYRSTSYYDGNHAYYLYIHNGDMNTNYADHRRYGMSVRLVKGDDLNHCGYLNRVGTDVREACDSLRWIDGVKYIASTNNVQIVLQTDEGCDSTVHLNLTIHPSLSATDHRLSETPYTWINGVTYSENTNMPKDTLHTVYGCDSIVTLNFTIVPAGVLPGDFTVTAGGTKVKFSKGNLQYQGSTDTWRFAGHQYDYIGNMPGNTAPSASQTAWMDLFGFGTSGWNSGAVAYRPYSTSTNSAEYYPGGSLANNLTGLYVRADWGAYNRISNAENAEGQWRTLSRAEWEYLIYTRAASNVNGVANARYCKAVVHGVNGMILFPDVYTHPDVVPQPTVINCYNCGYGYNNYSDVQFAQMEAEGAVFLPAAGYRDGTGTGYTGSIGYYRSSSYYDGNSAYYTYFDGGNLNTNWADHRRYGMAVRVVKGSDLTACGYLNRTSNDVRVACDSLRWIDGVKYVASNTTATHVVRTAAGCDSTINLKLTIHNSVAITDMRMAEHSLTWINGNTYYASTTTPTHTLTTSHGCDSVVTLNLTIVPSGRLPGSFHVASGTVVNFSKGNLQYRGSSDTWRFAEHQYDIVGNALGNTNPLASQEAWMDLFGWGTSGWNSGANAYRPYSTSTTNDHYYLGGDYTRNLTGDYVRADWGRYNAISNGGNSVGMWRVLTQSEWNYLFNVRSASNVNGVANARYCRAVVNGRNGILLFPDNYTHPQFVPQPVYINCDAGFNTNVYTAAQFAQMEASGVVMLPSAGYRNGTGITNAGDYGWYWSSTVNGGYVYTTHFTTGLNTANSDYRFYGFAVRMVRESNNNCGYVTRTGTDVRVECDSLLWIDGNKYFSNNNSATFTAHTAEGCDSIVTLNLTIKASSAGTDTRVVEGSLTWIDGNTYYTHTNTPTHTIVGGNAVGCDSVVTLNLTVHPIGTIDAAFSVAADRRVRFSSGNLQYQGSTRTWRFAEHQYDVIGDAAGNTDPSASQTAWMDLFGWGTSGYHNGGDVNNSYYYPYSTSIATVNDTYNKYGYGPSTNMESPNLTGSSANYDWGVLNAISNGSNTAGLWRTLTKDEWTYLLFDRSTSTVNGTSNARFCKAIVGTTNCLILFPDSYTHPSGPLAPVAINDRAADFTTNQYSTSEFETMEAAGAVLLPTAGYRNGTTVSYVTTDGGYWTATYYDAANAYYVRFNNAALIPTDDHSKCRGYGFAVRLVHDL